MLKVADGANRRIIGCRPVRGTMPATIRWHSLHGPHSSPRIDGAQVGVNPLSC